MKIKATFALFITAAGIGLFISSCSKDNGGGNNNFTVDCATVSNKAFAADVNPIIQSSCAIAGCHATGSFNGVGPLTNYTEVSTHKAKIRTAISNGSMPQNGTLSAAQKSSIICWIDNGALNN